MDLIYFILLLFPWCSNDKFRVFTCTWTLIFIMFTSIFMLIIGVCPLLYYISRSLKHWDIPFFHIFLSLHEPSKCKVVLYSCQQPFLFHRLYHLQLIFSIVLVAIFHTCSITIFVMYSFSYHFMYISCL